MKHKRQDLEILVNRLNNLGQTLWTYSLDYNLYGAKLIVKNNKYRFMTVINKSRDYTAINNLYNEIAPILLQLEGA